MQDALEEVKRKIAAIRKRVPDATDDEIMAFLQADDSASAAVTPLDQRLGEGIAKQLRGPSGGEIKSMAGTLMGATVGGGIGALTSAALKKLATTLLGRITSGAAA